MRGALVITYIDGSEDFFEVDPVGDNPDLADNLSAFLESPDVTLILDNEILVIPSTSIRHLSITRTNTALPEERLSAIPGVLLGVKRVMG
jgi:hypothetical protein